MKTYKKIYTFMLLVLMGLSIGGCEKETIKIIAPYGAPSYTTYFLDDYDVDIVEGADPLVAAFSSDTYDVIIAPTNLGAKFYTSSQDYQLLASIVWGNLYLISESETTLETLDQFEVIAFGQNQTPGIILSYVLEHLDIDVDVNYYSGASEVLSLFSSDPSQVYLIAEPQFSILEETYDLYHIDLQTSYENISGYDAYPQASIFVSHLLDDDQVDQLEKDFKLSIDKLYDEQYASDVASLLFVDERSVSSIMRRTHITYKESQTIIDEIEDYLELLKSYNSKLIDQIPSQDFYR